MSIDCMSAVLDRYPGGGGERLVALSLADNAARDGTSIFPSVEDLAHRSRLSSRAVQRHLQKMVATGWLVVVHVTTGRRGDTNEYRISPQWLDGQACIPPDAPIVRQPRRKPKQLPLDVVGTPDGVMGTGDILSPVKSVDNSRDTAGPQVTKQVVTGDTSVTQTVINHQNTNTPLTPLPARNCGQLRSKASGQHPNNRTSGLAGKQGAKAPAVMLPKGSRWMRNRGKVEAVGERIGLGRWDQARYEKACMRSVSEGALCSFSVYALEVINRVDRLRKESREVDHAGA